MADAPGPSGPPGPPKPPPARLLTSRVALKLKQLASDQAFLQKAKEHAEDSTFFDADAPDTRKHRAATRALFEGVALEVFEKEG